MKTDSNKPTPPPGASPDSSPDEHTLAVQRTPTVRDIRRAYRRAYGPWADLAFAMDWMGAQGRAGAASIKTEGGTRERTPGTDGARDDA